MERNEQICKLENEIKKSKEALKNTSYKDEKIQKIYEEMMNCVIEENMEKLKELKTN